MEAVLTANQESYQVKVISTKGDTVLVDCPRNAIGSMIRFPKGTRVTLAFFTKMNKGFSINSQVLGTADTSFGTALQLSHAGGAKPMTQRRFRRRQALLTCGYFTVRMEESKGKKPPKMVVDHRRITGTTTDISIGGCSIKTNYSVPPGSRLKIEFDATQSADPVAVLGQVLRINRSGITATIMHVKFLKVPRRAMNVINSIVFEYSDD
jgi:c-di-GMP-binding flagellar brake protein YcgR